ncbi:MAG: hypothetical protein QW400_04490, partial [Candidatus Diapherotrites archaeon]
KFFAFSLILAVYFGLFSNGAFAQRVELATPVCYYDVNQMHEYFTDLQGNKILNQDFVRLFSAIESKPQNDPSIKDEIKRALRGQFYTGYLQLAYTVEGGQTNPFKGGNYAKCELGCFPQFTYFGVTYYNKCITRICTEGRIVGTPRFCDPKIGPDIYIHYLMFWCEDVPRATMICGPSAHCEQRADGTFLCEYNKVGSSSGDNSGIEYVLAAPADSSAPIIVEAYQGGKLIASKPINAEGPVYASQAYYYAQSTGLTSIVESKTTSTANNSSMGATTYSSSNSSNSSSSSSSGSWLSRIARFFGFGSKSSTNTTSTATTYNSSYSSYPTYQNSYSSYSYSSSYYSPTSRSYSYNSSYTSYTPYSYPSNYSSTGTYSSYKPTYSYATYTNSSSTYYPSYTSYSYSGTSYPYRGYTTYYNNG